MKPIIISSYNNKLLARKRRKDEIRYKTILDEYGLFVWWQSRIFLDCGLILRSKWV